MIDSDIPIPETTQNSRSKLGSLDMPGFRKLYAEGGMDRHQLLLDILASRPELFQSLREKRAINLAALQT
ncbi:MAG: hypothetical protein B7Z37_12015 [Verrucomicrobia bacterium 12-59-8]|nr:MAG: hypothetical protein B7Z37_12015 [Verrucomicrobia bacterium 12-59-8]